MGKNLDKALQIDRENELSKGDGVKEELLAQFDEMRAAVYELASYGLRLHVISQQEAADLTQNVDSKDEKDLKNLAWFVRDGIPSQRREYEIVHDTFNAMISEARGVLSLTSLNEWIDRFNTTSFLEKRYFIQHQFRSFIDNWKEVHEKRDRLETKAKMFLTKEEVPELATFLNGMAFKDLRYRDKKNLTAQVEAALASPESVDHSSLYMMAKRRLDGYVSEGILSRQKVGIWLHRIFGGNASLIQIKSFLGEGSETLSWYADKKWRPECHEFKKVMGELKESENIARGFNRISMEAFLKMDHRQRPSYLAEAKRTIEASHDIEKEASILLEIRHYLDIEDWEDADNAIRMASSIDLDPTDKLRLESMKKYLREHRKDSGPQKVDYSNADLEAADKGVSAAIMRMDVSLRPIGIGLAKQGNRAVKNFRWALSGYKWCYENGYIDNEKAQVEHDRHVEETRERAKRQEDRGRFDVVETGDSNLFRSYEHQKNSKLCATYQFLNIADDGVKSKTVDWYSKERPQRQLYFTTVVATKDGQAMPAGWHYAQLECMNELNRCTRILDAAGKQPSIVKGEEKNETPETSYATPA